MSQEPDDATRRVVKKVVKKTVVRPLAPTQPAANANAGTGTSPAARNPRRLRTPRLATPTRVPAARPSAPAPSATPAPAPAARSATPASPPPEASATTAPIVAAPAIETTEAKPAKARGWRPSLPSLPSLPKRKRRAKHEGGGRLRRVRYAITDPIVDGFAWVGDVIIDGWHWLIGLRLPHVSPSRGSAITGALVGLESVALGWGFYQLFSATRGTQAGGGWGFLALVFVAFVAFITGELLLSGFGVPLARVVSILSILVVLLMVLVFFIKLAAGMWAWLLIPALSAAAFVTSNMVMQIASQEQNEQRLPWEPTDESQVNLD